MKSPSLSAKENALRIINFDNPERVMSAPPVYMLSWHGCDHEGYQGGSHDSPGGFIAQDKGCDTYGTSEIKMHRLFEEFQKADRWKNST